MLKIIKLLVLLIPSFLSHTTTALQISSVTVPDQIMLAGEKLPLQGASIRNKFFIKVYVGAFYAQGKITSTTEAIEAKGPKSMWYRFLRDLDKDTIRKSWKEGLQNNNSESVLEQNQKLVNKFIDLIDNDISNGDIMTVDFIPGLGTQLSINGKVKGSISDEHFYPMVLKVWMGEHPPSQKFQKGLLNLN